jgi:drug/metabolite transporter (DMT)-like permease
VRAGLLGVIGTAVPMTSMVSSLQYQSSGVTAVLVTLSPVVTVILAHFFLADETLSRPKVVGVIIAFLGAGVLLLRGETGLADFVRADWRGYAWAGMGILASGGSVVYARRYLRSEENWDVSSVRMVVAALALLPIVSLTVGYDMRRVTSVGYMGLLYASLIGTFCGMWLNFYIVKRYGATLASQTAYIMPVITTTLGALVLGERVTWGMLVGMTVIFSGLTILNWESMRRSVSVSAIPGGNPISPGKT